MQVFFIIWIIFLNTGVFPIPDDQPGIKPDQSGSSRGFEFDHGGIIRGDTSKKELALVFTGDSYADGGDCIRQVLAQYQVKASFFFTGNFYRNSAFRQIITALKADGHYLGAHSDQHLLYCDWENRDSLLVEKDQFISDLSNNYLEMKRFGIEKMQAGYFLPPFEWYNSVISDWCREFGLMMVNFSRGTWSHADWTIPAMGTRYVSSEKIFNSILAYEQKNSKGLNGFILLSHIGTAPERSDKFYLYLDPLIQELRNRGYSFKRIDELLN